MLEINDLKKTFDNGTPALKGINLKVNKGEFVSILGPSGSGKTTLLRSINGLETSSGGEIYFDNKIVNKNTILDVQKKKPAVSAYQRTKFTPLSQFQRFDRSE